MTTGADGRRLTFLVTGAAGFIGSALCRLLVARGHEVVGYDNLSRGRAEYLPHGVRLIEGDIRDLAGIRRAVSTSLPDCVVHLAAMHFIPDCIARPDETMAVNVDGTGHVLESCRGTSVRRVIFASSAAVYAPTDHASVEEETPLAPLEVYGRSKAAAEQLVDAFQQETGIPASSLRFANAIGRNETNPHVVPHIFETLRHTNLIALGNTAPRRDYIDTRDLASAILAVATEADASGAFNVGCGVTYSVDDVVEALRRILGRRIDVVQEPSRVRSTERMVLAVDIAKIRRVTGWTPRLTLDDSLSDLVMAYGLATAPFPAS